MPWTPEQLEAFLTAFERIAGALTSWLPTLGIIAVALINRGIKAAADDDEDKDVPAVPAASAQFSAGLLHTVASQDRRINELELQLAHAEVENKELRGLNIRVQRENAELRNKVTDAESRISALEQEMKVLKHASPQHTD